MGDSTGRASWLSGHVDDFWFDESDDSVHLLLNSAVNGFDAGVLIRFASESDFVSGTNGTVTGSALTFGTDTDVGVPEGGWLNKLTGEFHLNGKSGRAGRLAGNIEDFWVQPNDAGAGVGYRIAFSQDVSAVSEPSSFVLLAAVCACRLICGRRKRLVSGPPAR